MINNEILSFIKEQTAQGSAKDEIKNLLITQGGWDEKDVEEAFDTISFAARSYPSAVKSATADLAKDFGNAPLSSSGLAAAPFSQQASASNAAAAPSPVSEPIIRPASFAPGLSRVEQPKIMEPSSPDPFRMSTSSPMAAMPSEGVSASKEPKPAVSAETAEDPLSRLRARIASGVVAPPTATAKTSPQNNPLDQFKVSPLNRSASSIEEPRMQPASKKEAVISSPVAGVSFGAQPKIDPIVKNPAPPQAAPAAETRGKTSPAIALFQGISRNFGASPSSPGIAAAPLGASSLPASPSLPSAGGSPSLIFPKSDSGISRISPTPAQLATLKAQKRQGGRFLLGLVMFLTGILIGGISMNAYMNGYLNKAGLDTITDKVMNLIGLDTPAPLPVTDPVPANTGS